MKRFSRLLPLVQCCLTVAFGGYGAWQRTKILSQPFFGVTLANTTAAFHVWPWPYKFAAVSQLPALLASFIPTFLLSAICPTVAQYFELLACAVCVWLMWSYIGSKFDLRWHVRDKTPWIVLMLFTLVCLAGALLPLGYTGYLPYGLIVWVLALILIGRVPI